MPINIVNEEDYIRFVSLEVAGQNLIPLMNKYCTASHSASEVVSQKRMLAEYMAIRYLMDRLRTHWQTKENLPFLTPVSPKANNLNQMLPWVQNALKNNEKVYRFDATKIPLDDQREMRRVGLFLTAMAEEYIVKTSEFSEETGRPLRLFWDYLKGKHDYPTYEMALQATIRWEQNEYKQQTKNAQIRRVMDLPNGYYAVELLNREAMQLEGKKMANCLCDELQPYISDVVKETPSLRIYSIRNKQGTPRVDITVRREAHVISDCAAKANDFVHREDVPAVAAFVNALQMPMRIMAMRHARLLENNGRYYDVFNLPHDLRFHDSCLDLEGLDLTELPFLENVVLAGSFMCAHNRLKNLKGAPKIIRGCFSFYDNPIESFTDFPEYVGSVVTPIPVSENTKSYIKGDITIRPLLLQINPKQNDER